MLIYLKDFTITPETFSPDFMKIALSWIKTGDPKTGLEVFAQRFISALAGLDKENQYLVTGAFWRRYRLRSQETKNSLPDHFACVFRRRPRNLENFLDWRLSLFLQERALLKEGIDIYHGIDQTLPPLKRIRSIITVHDIGFKVHPEWFPVTGAPFAWHNTFERALRQSDRVIAISRHTRDEILSYYSFKPEKVRVVYYGGTGKEFQPIEDTNVLDSFRNQYHLKGRFILSVAPTAPHKNMVRLVQAFGLIAKELPEINLVLAGGPGKDHPAILAMAKKMGVAEKMIFLPVLPNSELVFLYNLAEIFVFPSLYEGFGLPVLEAMSCGCPVVASRATSLPEVAGDAALLVDPYQPEDIASAMKKLLEGRDLQAELRARGLEQARRFSWEKTAGETLAIYRELSG